MHKLFAVVLAVLTAGAQVVCACPNSFRQEVARPVRQACAGQAECCRKAEMKHENPPVKQEPCEKCNLKNQVQAVADQTGVWTLGEPVLCTLPPSVDIFAGADFGAMQLGFAQESPPPMLLRDLFHVHSLLLN